MTDTQQTEDWEGPPLDQEEEEESPGNPQPEPTSSIRREGNADTAQNRDSSGSSDDEEASAPQSPNPEENKENVEERGVKDPPEKGTAPRGRSRSRPTRRLSAKPSKMSDGQRDGGSSSMTAVSNPDKRQSLPPVYEDKETANKGQLVKRNRRRNKKSGYESSATEEMPLRERQYPPQQQMQMQQPEAGKKSDPIRLRLDLNLEVEVELKARIHGDLTLSLF
ncbi:hypothetical protein TWF481_010501 [Arthrobotrys musiformis]|uniref:Uncharacterized protein n=1 Tax=Arthrobotrys musiformis TaxID=47236 RepID=A0AAV9W142_9PEZI